MQNVLLLIRDQMDLLPSSERKIAQYILDNPKEVIHLSVKELGAKSGASAAAVIRMVKSLKFEGFTDLKLQLTSQLGSQSSDYFTDFKESSSITEIKDQMAVNIQHFIGITRNNLTEEIVEEFVRVLEKSQRIFVYGIGASYIIAKDFEQKFSRLGKQVFCSMDQHGLVALMATGEGDGLFVGISSSGEKIEVSHLLEVAKELNITTISITEDSNNSLAKLADIPIKTSNTDKVLLRSGATMSMINQLYVVGVIYNAYLTKNYDHNIQLLMSTKRATGLLEDLYKHGEG